MSRAVLLALLLAPAPAFAAGPTDGAVATAPAPRGRIDVRQKRRPPAAIEPSHARARLDRVPVGDDPESPPLPADDPGFLRR